MNLDAVIQLHRTGDIVGAETGYRELISQRLKDADVYNNLALICLNSGRLEEGIALVQTALKIAPRNPEAHLNMGVALQQKGCLEAATTSIHEALKLNPAYHEAYNNLGIVYFEQGKWEQSIAAYRMAISLKNDFVQSHYNLGNVLRAVGLLDEAAEAYRQTLELDPKYQMAYLNLGNVLHDKGSWDEAVECYERALKVFPDFAEAHNNMGNALRASGKLVEAIACFHRALEINPELYFAHYSIGLLQAQQGELEAAIASYKKAILINQYLPQAHFNLGLAYMQQGKVDEALACFKKAVQVNPKSFEAHNNLGVLYCELGDFDNAIASYRQAVSLKPDYADAHYNLGNVLRVVGRPDQAIAAYGSAVKSNPLYTSAHLNMGNAFQEMLNWTDAAVCYRKVLELNPNYPEGHNNLGTALRELGDFAGSLACYKRALELKPDYDQAYYNQALSCQEMGKWNDAVETFLAGLKARVSTNGMSSKLEKLASLLIELERIPIIYKDTEELERTRQKFMAVLTDAGKLAANTKTVFTKEERTVLRQILFRINNFYLVYQQLNDLDIQVAYARLAGDIMRAEIESYTKLEHSAGKHAKIRVGIASENLKRHNGASWSYGWLSNLPAADYEFFLYAINGRGFDDLTEKFAQLGTFRVLQFKEHDYLRALEVIKQDELDIFILPDVGMTGSSKILSLTRLAPIQCVCWGHPVTSGSSNMDYFISNELMETPDSDMHYSEKLIRLPKIGVHLDYPIVSAEKATKSDFGIPKNKVVYGAVQSLFKYLPQFDYIYPEIAKKVPNALFIFVEASAEATSEAFKTRLQASFDKAGVSFKKHVKILPRMGFQEFMKLLGVLDIYLDSIGFSGGMTAARSLAVDCPVVTMVADFMRGRLGFAMLKMIEIDDLIANSPDEFIELSSKLGTDKDMRSTISARIKAQKHKLFNDMACVEHLDKFFKSEVSRLQGR